jgi:hypothetical protein
MCNRMLKYNITKPLIDGGKEVSLEVNTEKIIMGACY